MLELHNQDAATRAASHDFKRLVAVMGYDRDGMGFEALKTFELQQISKLSSSPAKKILLVVKK